MPHLRPALLLAPVALLVACGGGSKKSTPVAATHRVSGTISAAAATAADWDVADKALRQSNDDRAHAQPLPSAVTVGGWVAATTDTFYDPVDVYKVPLAQGQRILLVVGDAANADLELCFVDADGAALQQCVLSSPSGPTQIDVAQTADYFLELTARRGASLYTLALGAGPAPAAAASAVTLRTDTEFVPGEVLVRFREDAGPARGATRALPERARALGLAMIAGAPGHPALLGLGKAAERARALALLGVAPATPGTLAAPLDAIQAEKLDTLRAVKALRARADVETADPNYVFHPSYVPNDPLYSKYQWHYPAISLPQAWDVTRAAPVTAPPIVAVIDTGVFLAHEDLQGQLVAGYDFISDSTRARDNDPPGASSSVDPNPDDPGDDPTPGASSFHGTHVAGTIAAATGNGLGVAGVAFQAKVMPVRALGVGGGTSFDIIQGLLWAAGLDNAYHTPPPARRADVVNLSIGCLNCASATEQNIYDRLRAAGVVVVAAAGNESTSTASYPASYAGVISVSAVGPTNALAPYSNFGASIDVAAPGGDAGIDLNKDGIGDGIASTLADDTSGSRKSIYAAYVGTSMAAPHVAGVVALMKVVCPSLAPAKVDELLAADKLTVDLGPAGRDDQFGHGRIDALKAVQAAQSECGVPVAPALQVTPARLDFVPGGETSATLAVVQTGGDAQHALTVTGTTVKSVNAGWLSVAAPAGASGLGTYTVTANTASLRDAVYSATITFTVSGGSNVQIPVTLHKGVVVPGAVGWVYVLLADRNLNVVSMSDGPLVGTSLPFSFAGVADGRYVIAAGTDLNADGNVCDPGEACGAWPSLGAPAPVVVSGSDVPDADFSVGFDSTLGGTAPASLLAPGTKGLPRAAPVRLGERP